jgi:hypothetical protein
MIDDPENNRRESAQKERNEPELSRRSFLNRMTIAGVGLGAVVVLGMRETAARIAPAADTAPLNPAAGAEATEAETAQLGEAVELEVDPDDPATHFAQYWRRRRRRYWRRRRRYWRRGYRRYWRRRRRWRRRYWRRRYW